MSYMIFGRVSTRGGRRDIFSDTSSILKGITREFQSLLKGSLEELGSLRTECHGNQVETENADLMHEWNNKTNLIHDHAVPDAIPFSEPVPSVLKSDSNQKDFTGIEMDDSPVNDAVNLFKETSGFVVDLGMGIKHSFKALFQGIAADMVSLNQDIQTFGQENVSELKKNAESHIKSILQQISGLEKTAQNQQQKNDVNNLNKILKALRKKVIGSKTRKELQIMYTAILNTKKKILGLFEDGNQKIHEFIIEQAISSFNEMGFRVRIESQTKGDSMLLAEKESKNALIRIDNELGIVADFSKGYENTQEEECIDDAVRFVASLKKKGIDVQLDKTRPIKHRGRASNERKKSSKRKSANKKTMFLK